MSNFATRFAATTDNILRSDLRQQRRNTDFSMPDMCSVVYFEVYFRVHERKAWQKGGVGAEAKHISKSGDERFAA
jgi:hypothetical protein